MVRTSSRSVFLFAVILLAGCGAPTPTPGGGSDGGSQPPKTGPVVTSFTLDTAAAQTTTVDATGGTVTATGSDGSTYVLTVPAGALYAATDITLTPLKDVTVDGATAAGQVGVQLGPEGTLFLQPVTLEVKTAAAVDASSAVTQVDASTHLYIPEGAGQSGSDFQASLDHFSTYVVTPLTSGRVSRAASGLLTTLASPPSRLQIEALLKLWVRSDALGLAQVSAKLHQAVEQAIGAYDDAATGNTSPKPTDVLGTLILGRALAASGHQAEGAAVSAAGARIFATLMRLLKLQLNQATIYSDYLALVSSLRATRAIAAAFPAVLQGGAVIDPSTLAGTLIDDMRMMADADCDAARYDTGSQELTEVIQAVADLGLSSPSSSELKADAATCVPPVVTGLEVPAGSLAAHATYNPNTGGSGTVNDDLEPPSAATVSGSQSETASASASGADGTASLSCHLSTKSSTVSLSLDVQSTATVSGQEVAYSSAGIGQSGTAGDFYIDVDHTRGPSLVKITWDGGNPTSSGVASATLSGDVQGVTLWPSGTPNGSATGSLPGQGYVPGTPSAPDRILVHLQAAASAGRSTASQDGSASIQGTVTVQVLPDPQT